MNRRGFIASLFIAPIAPKIARVISPPRLTLAQKLALQMKEAMNKMRMDLDRQLSGVPYHQANTSIGTWLGITREGIQNK